MAKSRFTHRLKKSGQLAFQACWWPSKDPSLGHLEKERPLMYLEGGQITRVRADNMVKVSTI